MKPRALLLTFIQPFLASEAEPLQSINFVSEIRTSDAAYEVAAKYKNVKTDGAVQFGVAVSNISFLTVEETRFTATTSDNNSFVVSIPKTRLTKN